jgi:hypothetical protein
MSFSLSSSNPSKSSIEQSAGLVATISRFSFRGSEQVERFQQGTFSLDDRRQDGLVHNQRNTDGMSGKAGPDTFRCRILDHSECDVRRSHCVRKFGTCRCHVSKCFVL